MSSKILTIDDHTETVQLIDITLSRRGYQVLGAHSGSEGLQMAERERPDLILLDIMMPDMDGIAVCRALRQNPDLQDTPIIMFTAKDQVDDKLGGFEAGADDYLTKPTRPAELLERVEAMLARRRKAPRVSSDTPDEGSRTAVRAPDTRFITVLGSRGGAGATTVAVNLATTLADEGSETILVDLDTRQGHVAMYLGHDVKRDLVEWLGQPLANLEETLPDYLVRQQDGLQLLLSRPHLTLKETGLSAPQVAALGTVLGETGNSVVVDLGSHQPGEVQRPLLRQSDTVLVCLRPERPAIVAAKQLLEHVQETLGRPDAVKVLMLDYGHKEKPPRPSVESFLRMSLLGELHLDQSQITRAVNRSQPLIYTTGNGELARRFQEVARQLVAVQSGP